MCFNPRTYIRYDLFALFKLHEIGKFQSTYLYKVRRSRNPGIGFGFMFQSTYLYKVRLCYLIPKILLIGFNPRTYIRYDLQSKSVSRLCFWFQSTYLYKVRPIFCLAIPSNSAFQSTYLYKVRHENLHIFLTGTAFQSTYLYKVRLHYK